MRAPSVGSRCLPFILPAFPSLLYCADSRGNCHATSPHVENAARLLALTLWRSSITLAALDREGHGNGRLNASIPQAERVMPPMIALTLPPPARLLFCLVLTQSICKIYSPSFASGTANFQPRDEFPWWVWLTWAGRHVHVIRGHSSDVPKLSGTISATV